MVQNTQSIRNQIEVIENNGNNKAKQSKEIYKLSTKENVSISEIKAIKETLSTRGEPAESSRMRNINLKIERLAKALKDSQNDMLGDLDQQ